jgi:hypothetical protein
MYEELLGDIGFYRLLLRFDEDLAAATRALGCWRCGKGCMSQTSAANRAGSRRVWGSVPRALQLLLRGPAVSQAPHMPLAALSEPQGISGGGGGAGLGSVLRIDTAATAVSAGVGRGEPADDLALAPVVVGGVHPDAVLACGRRHTAAAAGAIAITGLAPGALCRHCRRAVARAVALSRTDQQRECRLGRLTEGAWPIRTRCASPAGEVSSTVRPPPRWRTEVA